MTAKIALILPILNEAASLSALLTAIGAQTLRPTEIIFVDAGSTDRGPAMIESWWKASGWPNGRCKVLANPGGMPGANRNFGIHHTTLDWIAFLDGGIEPEPNWLEHLWDFSVSQDARAVFGVCHFSAEAPFERAVCALSYGFDSTHPVIPASLFHRSVFDAIGFFPEHLRAAEDLFWVQRYLAHFGSRLICHQARVHYQHFPTTWSAAFRKWRINERHSVRAGVRRRQHFAYIIGIPLLYGLAAGLPGIGLPLFMTYLGLRGVADPIRRSQRRCWWGKQPSTIIQGIVLACVLDIAKLTGITQEWARQLRKAPM